MTTRGGRSSNAVSTKYAVMNPVNTFPSEGLLRKPRIDALSPMTSIA